MTFSQMQELLRAVVETQTLQNESLKLHSELLTRAILGLDVVGNRLDRLSQTVATHDREIAEIRLAQAETTDKLNALIDVVNGLVKGDK